MTQQPTLLSLYRRLSSAQRQLAVQEAHAHHYRLVVADLKARIEAREAQERESRRAQQRAEESYVASVSVPVENIAGFRTMEGGRVYPWSDGEPAMGPESADA